MSGTSDDAENDEGSSGSTKPDLTALVSAASALVTAVGALALTGALGRVQRNSGELFALAIGAIILGATLAAIGSMISLKARPSLRLTDRHIGLRAAIQGAGVALTAVGLVFGLAVTIGTADNNESPSLTFSMPEETGRPVTGVVTAGSMSSNDRLTVDVDRLKRTEGQDEYKHDRRLFRAVVGPNGDGEASTNVLIPASGGPTGIRAYVGANPVDCPGYPGEPSDDGGPTGCAIVDLEPP